MSQRNPLNDRYTTDAAKGKTRKSAAAAKPVSKAASSVRVQSTKKTKERIKAEKKAARRAAWAEEAKYRNPPTQEFKRWRIIFWVALGLAIVFTILSWVLQEVLPEYATYISIGLAYLVLIFAFWVDFYKCRRLRQKYREECEAKQTKLVKKVARQAKTKAAAAAQRYEYTEEEQPDPEPVMVEEKPKKRTRKKKEESQEQQAREQ